jgi:hypothetical protein
LRAIARCFSGSMEAKPRVETDDFLEDSIEALIVPLSKKLLSTLI